MPKTYEEALLKFGFFIRLEEKEAEELSTFARLKNILAHEYLEVTYGSIKKFIDVSPAIYQKIFDFLSQHLKE